MVYFLAEKVDCFYCKMFSTAQVAQVNTSNAHK